LKRYEHRATLANVCPRKGSPASAVIPLGLRSFRAQQTSYRQAPSQNATAVDDGARLASFADDSLDFVVANHMLEYIEDSIAALEHQLRVLKPGGILYLTLPDARDSFDSPRQRTTVEHLLRDHHDGPEGSRSEHYEECAD
jgi:predicted SAM-dependent methyltransferase